MDINRDEQIMKFGGIEVEKQKFYHNKGSILEDVRTDNILVFNKVFSYRRKYKYFSGYFHDDC